MDFRNTVNSLAPDLQRKLKAARDTRPILEGIGEAGVQLAKRAFNEPGLRPSYWPNKVDGSPATLRKNQVLARSPRVTQVNARSVSMGSDRTYAAIHQLGGRTRAHKITAKPGKALFWKGARHPVKSVNHPGSRIPARPYFPFRKNGTPTLRYQRAIGRVIDIRLGIRGR